MALRILGIAGSLRKQSYNRFLLDAAKECLGSNGDLQIFDLEGIPPFNQDLEMQPPETVVALKKAIRNSDALLIATPEYNYSISGVLKNAIDWATRPYCDNPFNGKAGAIM